MYRPKMKVWVHGAEQELYTIGYVAKLLKRSVETLRSWERKQVIPKAMYKANNGVRLYHPKEVDAMKKALRKTGNKYARGDDLKNAMWAALTEVREELVNGKKQD